MQVLLEQICPEAQAADEPQTHAPLVLQASAVEPQATQLAPLVPQVVVDRE